MCGQKLLFISKRASPDIEMSISFLCTRVLEPTHKNKVKLTRPIGTNSFSVLITWMDASYAVHRDMRGHTGNVISMGQGFIIHNCGKQKLNTKSSTESEIFCVSDLLPYAIWASYFLKSQGYQLSRNIFYQDNTSEIKMLKNGKDSCGNRSRHMHIRYFFTKDVLQREKMELMYCPTDDMIADFYTKPLQGRKYYRLRNIIMGYDTMPVEERAIILSRK